MALDLAPRRDGRAHVVHFYDSDGDLVDVVAAYLAEAVTNGDVAVTVATPQHEQALVARLASLGVSVDAEVATGGLVLLDAAETLDQIMVDSRPDKAAFEAVVGEIIRVANERNRPARVYGEMVALLWSDGDVAGVLELERLWNDLAGALRFSLFCGYPAEVFSDPSLVTELAAVCHLHSAIVDEPGDAERVAVSQRFEGSTTGPRHARQFVDQALHRWNLEHLSETCALVVSELAANAILHAGTAFSLSLSRVGDGVHISVGDGSPSSPRLRAPERGGPGGRGLQIVSQMARDWGHVPGADGKLVWAIVG
ncbi:MAG TPA: MEDS domain-containing protein [Acidimicrobiales bacterium]|nr:MEDS domain-containing protein [Acidimicrobiales bacterium]